MSEFFSIRSCPLLNEFILSRELPAPPSKIEQESVLCKILHDTGYRSEGGIGGFRNFSVGCVFKLWLTEQGEENSNTAYAQPLTFFPGDELFFGPIAAHEYHQWRFVDVRISCCIHKLNTQTFHLLRKCYRHKVGHNYPFARRFVELLYKSAKQCISNTSFYFGEVFYRSTRFLNANGGIYYSPSDLQLASAFFRSIACFPLESGDRLVKQF